MISKQMEDAIRAKIQVVSGKEFQELFWAVMLLRCGDFQTPRMQKDLGNDGYSIDKKIFCACYAPESLKYDNAGTVEKIRDDYQLFCDNWKDKHSFEKWVFVTKENLMGKPHQKLVELNALNDGVSKENWGMEQFVRECLCLDNVHLVRIFNLPAPYLETVIDEQKDFGIISEVFDFIFKNKIESIDVSTIKGSENYTELTQKIALNFVGDEAKTVKDMIVHNWQRKALVEKYIELETGRDSSRTEALVDMIQSDFRRIKSVEHHGVPIESVRIIEDLAKEYLNKDKQSNPEYVACARAIVLYYFELCFLGQKTIKEIEIKEEVF